ncbi:hypothetical protein [Enterococcus sp.]|uniref:hypothetical protein n=1 Tax=Enterococcus sp. TaxID=35783 RepID=UPI002912D89F|nr:hypothetical protein [Enterococcus sp.]MDU5336628.1 hypothetical protein [Enterococcus sp.]
MSNHAWLQLIQSVFIVLVVLIVIALIFKSINGLIWARTTYQFKIHKQDDRFKFERGFGTKIRLLIQRVLIPCCILVLIGLLLVYLFR